MARRSGLLLQQTLREQAAAHLHPVIEREIDKTELRLNYDNAPFGWHIASSGGTLQVVFPRDWPFSPPELFIGKNHPHFGGVHVERNGKLCLAPPQSTFSQRDPLRLLDELIQEAGNLFSRGIGEKEEFVQEFQSYWIRDMQPARWFHTLHQIAPPSRMIAGWQGLEMSLFADSGEEIETWIRRRFSSKKANLNINPQPFIWFSEGLQPSEFPRTGHQFLNLVDRFSPDAIPLLKEIATRADSRQPFIFGFETASGPAQAGISIDLPSDFFNGFRRGSMVPSVAFKRFYGAGKISPRLCQRVDHNWIHARGGEIDHRALKEKNVAIIGCGSLGSGVAMNLAKCGVGKMTLFDSELLSYDNIARHQLGAPSTGKRKATALEEEINRQMPTIQARGITARWQDALDKDEVDFSTFDLVITTTGDWICDSLLNFEGRKNPNFPPVVFGWLEEHALAGHALAAMDIGGCFGCGVDEFGKFRDRLTRWPSPTLVNIPACGGAYQPYGPGYLAHTQGQLSILAVEVLLARVTRSVLRSWVSSKVAVEEAGGLWTEHAITNLPPEGGFINKSWGIAANCELCQ